MYGTDNELELQSKIEQLRRTIEFRKDDIEQLETRVRRLEAALRAIANNTLAPDHVREFARGAVAVQ